MIRERFDDPTEHWLAGGEPPTVCDTCGDVVEDGSATLLPSLRGESFVACRACIRRAEEWAEDRHAPLIRAPYEPGEDDREPAEPHHPGPSVPEWWRVKKG